MGSSSESEVPASPEPPNPMETSDTVVTITAETKTVVWEDLGQELEDFIYLARLGCTDDAFMLYQARLETYQYKHFPILLEYIEVRRTRLHPNPRVMLREDLDEIEDLCNQRSLQGFEGQGQRAVLELYSHYCSVVRRNDETTDSNPEESITIHLAMLEQLVLHTTIERFDATLWHWHELRLRTRILDTRLSTQDRKSLYPFFKRCCTALLKLSRPWEAFQLLYAIYPGMVASRRPSAIYTFFEEVTSGFSKSALELEQPVKLAYLNGLVFYLATQSAHGAMNDVLQGSPLQPRYCKGQAEQLFAYFFGALKNAKGNLFELLQTSYNSDDEEESSDEDSESGGPTNLVNGHSMLDKYLDLSRSGTRSISSWAKETLAITEQANAVSSKAETGDSQEVASISEREAETSHKTVSEASIAKDTDRGDEAEDTKGHHEAQAVLADGELDNVRLRDDAQLTMESTAGLITEPTKELAAKFTAKLAADAYQAHNPQNLSSIKAHGDSTAPSFTSQAEKLSTEIDEKPVEHDAATTTQEQDEDEDKDEDSDQDDDEAQITHHEKDHKGKQRRRDSISTFTSNVSSVVHQPGKSAYVESVISSTRANSASSRYRVKETELEERQSGSHDNTRESLEESGTTVNTTTINPAVLDEYGIAWTWTWERGQIKILERLSKAERAALVAYTATLKDRRSLHKALAGFTAMNAARNSRRAAQLHKYIRKPENYPYPGMIPDYDFNSSKKTRHRPRIATAYTPQTLNPSIPTAYPFPPVSNGPIPTASPYNSAWPSYSSTFQHPWPTTNPSGTNQPLAQYPTSYPPAPIQSQAQYPVFYGPGLQSHTMNFQPNPMVPYPYPYPMYTQPHALNTQQPQEVYYHQPYSTEPYPADDASDYSAFPSPASEGVNLEQASGKNLNNNFPPQPSTSVGRYAAPDPYRRSHLPEFYNYNQNNTQAFPRPFISRPQLRNEADSINRNTSLDRHVDRIIRRSSPPGSRRSPPAPREPRTQFVEVAKWKP